MDKERFLKSSENICEKFNASTEVEFLSIPLFNKDLTNNPNLWSIPAWIRDINYLISETQLCLTYSRIYDQELKEGGYGLLEFNRNIYIKTILNNLFSFGEKISILFFEIIGLDKLSKNNRNRELYEQLSLYNLKTELEIREYKDIPNKDILTEEDFKNIKAYTENLYNISKSKSHKKIFNFRNANVHRWSIGIDSFGAGIFKRDIKQGYCTVTMVNDNIKFNDLINNIEEIIEEFNKLTTKLIYNLSIFNK